MSKTRTWPEIIREATRVERAQIRTAISAVVVSYDAGTQTADVQPIIKNPVMSSTTRGITYEEMPVIPNVPVAFPRSTTAFFVFPLAKGDHVLLVFEELSNAEYRESGQMSQPSDIRRHSIGYPIAIPCVIADQTSVPASPPDGVAMGIPGNERVQVKTGVVELGSVPTDAVPLDSKLQTELAKIAATLATGVAPSGGGPVTFGTPYSPALTKSLVIKAK